MTFAEVLATSDVPGGVVNILTGSAATDRAVAGLAHGRQRDRPDRPRRRPPSWPPTLEVAAADNLKRVRRAPAAEPDWTADPGLDRMTGVPGDQDRLAPDRRLRGLSGLSGPRAFRSAGRRVLTVAGRVGARPVRTSREPWPITLRAHDVPAGAVRSAHPAAAATHRARSRRRGPARRSAPQPKG